MVVVFYRATRHIIEALGVFSRPGAWGAMSFAFSSKLLLLSSVYSTSNKLHFTTGVSLKLLERWIKSTMGHSLNSQWLFFINSFWLLQSHWSLGKLNVNSELVNMDLQMFYYGNQSHHHFFSLLLSISYFCLPFNLYKETEQKYDLNKQEARNCTVTGNNE